MTDPNQLNPNQGGRNPIEFMKDHWKKAAVIATIGAASLGGALGIGKFGGGKESTATASSALSIERVTGFADYSVNSADYDSDNFLPKAEQGIDDAAEAQQYIEDLNGGNDGPFGAKVDPASLAGMVAVITEPARDKKVANPNYDYPGVFKSSLTAYKAPGGVDRANDDYRATMETLSQVAGFDSQWAAKGEKVTQVVAVRNEQNEITGVKLKSRVITAAIGGVVLKMPKTETTKLDGFSEGAITDEGEFYFKGVHSESGSRGKKEQENGGSSKKADKKNRGDSQGENHQASRSNAGEGQSDKKTENQQRGGGASSGSQRKSTSGSGSGSKGSSGGGGSNNAGKGSGSSSKGSSGGGGSGKKGGSGGGKGGGAGGGCGGSCGSGNKGGQGGGGQGGGGEKNPSQPAPSQPAPKEPTPTTPKEPTPTTPKEPTPTTPEEPTPTTPTTPSEPIKPPVTCDKKIDAC